MTELNDRVKDILSLVEQNYEFLHVGMFFDGYAKRNDLSSKVAPIELTLDGGLKFRLENKLAKESLRDYFNQRKPTVFGYLVEWNAFRGIGMAMKEGLKNDSSFKDFVKTKLGDRYKHYHAILSFIRNVLSHNIHSKIQLEKKDYEDTLKYFLKNVDSSGIAKLPIKYPDDFPEIDPPSDHEFNIEVNFNLLIPETRFIEVISEWHLYMFSELCFNLVKAFRTEEKSTSQTP